VGGALATGNFLLIILSVISLITLGVITRKHVFFEHSMYFMGGTSPFIFGIAFGAFLLAMHAKPFSNNFINTVAQSCFGVYLIHDNTLIRPLLWNNLLNVKEKIELPTIQLIVYILLVSSVIYLITTLIDFIRIRTVARVFNGNFLYGLWKKLKATVIQQINRTLGLIR